MTEHINKLVNGELDGTNTSSESAELAGILELDASAKTLFEETEALFEALGNVPDVDPPAELKQRIMESIGREARAAPASTPGVLDAIRTFFQPVLSRPAWAMSYAFAAGLLVGVAALNVAGTGDIPETRAVQGTMGTTGTSDAAGSVGPTNARILDEAGLQVGDVTVDLATVRLKNGIVLDVTITGAGDSIVRVQTMDDSLNETTITASGAGHFTVSLDATDDILVTVTASGHEASARLLTSPA